MTTASSTDSGPAPESESFFRHAVQAIKTKGVKYSLVSVFNVIFGQTLLLFFNVVVFQIGSVTDEAQKVADTRMANAAAVLISAVPAFYLSRAWVWGKKGKSHFRKEVLPFVIFVAVGLVTSTLFVGWATELASHLTGIAATLLPNVVNIATFGVLWVLRFFLFDKIFHLDAPVDGDTDEPDVGAPPIL